MFLEPRPRCDVHLCSGLQRILQDLLDNQGILLPGLDTAWGSMRAMWDIALDCGANSISKCFEEGIQDPIRICKIVISKVKKNSGPFPDGDGRNRLVNKLGRSIVYGLDLIQNLSAGWHILVGDRLDSESIIIY